MKLNSIETALMNNPLRASLQRWYETPLLQRLGGRVDGQRVLEIGCGRGVGTQLILERFGAAYVQAFDLDPDMVEKARRRLAGYARDRVGLSVGDAAAIGADAQSFDAVFDFGIIHHVPDWRRAVSEVARVLRPAGRFFFEEVTRHALDRWLYRTFLDHPRQDRFTAEEFVAELERQGIVVGGNFRRRFFGDFVLGVGHREGATEDRVSASSAPGSGSCHLAPCGFLAQAQSFPQLHLPPLSQPQLVLPQALHFISSSNPAHKTVPMGLQTRCHCSRRDVAASGRS